MPPAKAVRLGHGRDVSTQHEGDSNSAESDTQRSRSEPGGSHAARRPPGACVHCRSLKIRCEFISEENVCVRCKVGGHECISRSRKKREPAPTHEDLQKRSYSQDLQIQSLLRQLDQANINARIQRWEAEAKVEAACLVDLPCRQGAEYPLLVTSSESESWRLPAIICDILSPCEIQALFNMFFERIHPYFAVLDPVLHTPQILISKSPFLFTVICAFASRWWTHRPRLHRLAVELGLEAAKEILRDGPKNIEACQAYMLITVFPLQKKRLCHDRRWLLLGTGIRIAQELKLDQAPPPELDEREKLNRTRTWFGLVCVDASYAIQMGKLPMVHPGDRVIQTSRIWYKSSYLNSPYDIILSGYAELLMLVNQFGQTTGRDKAVTTREDSVITAMALEYDSKLADLITYWAQQFQQDPKASSSPYYFPCTATTEMIGYCLRLTVLSTGLQHAAKRAITSYCPLLRTSMQVAQTVIRIVTERIYPSGILLYAIESRFMYITFAAAFLLNLLRPQFLPLLDVSQQSMIVDNVATVISILGSKDVALDNRHSPALFSRFLSSQLDALLQGSSIPRPSPSEAYSSDSAYWHEDIANEASSSGIIPETGIGADWTFQQFVSAMTADTLNIPASSTDNSSPDRTNASTPSMSSWWSRDFSMTDNLRTIVANGPQTISIPWLEQFPAEGWSDYIGQNRTCADHFRMSWEIITSTLNTNSKYGVCIQVIDTTWRSQVVCVRTIN
ncbi:hypothetical protein AcV5_003413 [Taiwanofungus camphoratus]|nr:hypothetical protein AcV5_003413 [Antrodia cinnamomea]